MLRNCGGCGEQYEGVPHAKRCEPCKTKKRVRSEEHKQYMAQYQKDHRDASRQRGYKLKNRYGIDEADWWVMLEAQEWACKICSRPWREDDVRAMWHTDHSHETGAVRGILCSTCNRGLGQFQDSPALMRQAALYVERGVMHCVEA
jgi:hypothetical protein